MRYEDLVIFSCPWCGHENSLVIEMYVGDIFLVHDCHNCCHPIEVKIVVSQGSVVDTNIRRAS